MREPNRITRAYLVCLIALALAPTVCAQTIPPVARVKVEREAARFLDSLAAQSRDDRVETAACLANYTVRDSVLTLERFRPAIYAFADSLNIGVRQSDGPICPDGAPVVHSHVARNAASGPSETDRATSLMRGTWNLLLSVYDNGWQIRLY